MNDPIGSFENIREQTAVADDKAQLKKGERLMLIIEDDVNFATIIRDYARHKGYQVVIALEGDEGLYYARKFKPNAIILDIQLPVMDGWTILKHIRNDEQLKDTPVHIISAFDDSRFKQADVMAYLKKPIDTDTLERAFGMLGDHIRKGLKQVLIISAVHFEEDHLHQLAAEKEYKLHFEQVATVSEAAASIGKQQYDCVIIHIGASIQLDEAKHIYQHLSDKNYRLSFTSMKTLRLLMKWSFGKFQVLLSEVLLRPITVCWMNWNFFFIKWRGGYKNHRSSCNGCN